MSAAIWMGAQAPRLLAGGGSVTVRQVRADDVERLADLIAGLSGRSCHQRYLAARSFTPATALAEAERIAAARTRRHIAFVAATALHGREELAGVAELARPDDGASVGELGIVVRDDLQGLGVGALLMRALTAVALQLGVRALQVELLADNSAMRRLAAHAGSPAVVGQSDGVLQLLVRLDAQAAARPGQGARRRAA